MKQKSLPTFLLTIVCTLIGGIVGSAFGGLLHKTLLPFWAISSIGLAPNDTADILFVDYQYLEALHLDNDILYVQTQSRNVYSGFPNKWEPLSPLPNGQTVSQIWLRDNKAQAPIVAIADQGEVYQIINNQWELLSNHPERFGGFAPINCAAEWYLPVIGIADSAGVVVSHLLANQYVCYVLFRDGHLQVWTRTTDAFSWLGILAISTLIGMVVGYNTISITKYIKSKRAKEKVSAN